MSAVAMRDAKISRFTAPEYKEQHLEDDNSSNHSASSPPGNIHGSENQERAATPLSCEETDLRIKEEDNFSETEHDEHLKSPPEDLTQKDSKLDEHNVSDKEDFASKTKENLPEHSSPKSSYETPHENKQDVEFSHAISHNLWLLLKSSLFLDVNVIVGDEKFHAHKIILSASSGYFYNEFLKRDETASYEHGVLTVNLGGPVSATGFKSVLKCMYTTRIKIDEASLPEAFKTAQFLQMPLLEEACAKMMGLGYSSSSEKSSDGETHKENRGEDFGAMDLTVNKKRKTTSDDFHPLHFKDDNEPFSKSTHLKKYQYIMMNKTKSEELGKRSHKEDYEKSYRDSTSPPHFILPENKPQRPFADYFSIRRMMSNTESQIPNPDPTTPPIFAPFSMARAAVMAMASAQLQHMPPIVSPTPVLPFPTSTQNSLGFQPYSSLPFGVPSSPHYQMQPGTLDKHRPDPTLASRHRLLLNELNSASRLNLLPRENSVDKTSSSNTEEKPEPIELTTDQLRKTIDSNENSRRAPPSTAKSQQAKPYKCLVCSAEFNRPANLKTHMRIHSGEKPYRCDQCGSRFVQVAHLRAHALIHTGEKPYQCKVCGTRFRHLQTLKSHIRIHTGEKPYSCGQCKLQFRHKSQLRLHLRTKHGINTNTKKTYQHVPGLRSDDISAHIKRTQEMIRVNQQINRNTAEKTMQ